MSEANYFQQNFERVTVKQQLYGLLIFAHWYIIIDKHAKQKVIHFLTDAQSELFKNILNCNCIVSVIKQNHTSEDQNCNGVGMYYCTNYKKVILTLYVIIITLVQSCEHDGRENN